MFETSNYRENQLRKSISFTKYSRFEVTRSLFILKFS